MSINIYFFFTFYLIFSLILSCFILFYLFNLFYFYFILFFTLFYLILLYFIFFYFILFYFLRHLILFSWKKTYKIVYKKIKKKWNESQLIWPVVLSLFVQQKAFGGLGKRGKLQDNVSALLTVPSPCKGNVQIFIFYPNSMS